MNSLTETPNSSSALYAWGSHCRYNDYSSYIKRIFSSRTQKITLHAGFTCPNRDGSKGWGGCTYCNNKSFNPSFNSVDVSISNQLKTGIDFFSKKYKASDFLAYFQSYTNTYGGLDRLKVLYEEALSYPGVKGLIIGTRPDCISEEILDYLATLNDKYFISVEYGVECCDNNLLSRINRCHSYEESEQAINKTAARKIHTGAHLILGLPGHEREKILQQATILSKLPLQTLKLHHLQIIKNTKMAYEYKINPQDFNFYSPDEYIDLIIDFLERLHSRIVIERFISESPQDMVIMPNWNRLKNFEFLAKLNKRMEERETWQGRYYDSIEAL